MKVREAQAPTTALQKLSKQPLKGYGGGDLWIVGRPVRQQV